MMLCNKISVVFLVFLLNTGGSSGQQPDYEKIFGRNWQKAEQFIRSNRDWIEPELEKYNIEFSEAMSVVFPELVRYSALQDKMELTILKTLYINLGEDYANFSIGQFQIKPSFAEAIYERLLSSPRLKEKKKPGVESDFINTRSFRALIVSNLENTQEQLKYLIVFLKICERNFNLRKLSYAERIKFLATAYNYSFLKPEREIAEMADKKFFSTGPFNTEYYSYSDIALFWYNQNRKTD
jgi:hypothetical protein